jgi:hypothetical protein
MSQDPPRKVHESNQLNYNGDAKVELEGQDDLPFRYESLFPGGKNAENSKSPAAP